MILLMILITIIAVLLLLTILAFSAFGIGAIIVFRRRYSLCNGINMDS